MASEQYGDVRPSDGGGGGGWGTTPPGQRGRPKQEIRDISDIQISIYSREKFAMEERHAVDYGIRFTN
jgi:hypothetical protein